MRITKALVGAALGATTGCTVGASTYPESPVVYDDTPYYDDAGPYDVAFEQPPSLVPIEPDVYVVHDYHTPVYYVDGSYWRYHRGGWYRASHWNTGWVSVGVSLVPRRIMYRNHRSYVRYAPRGATVYRAPARGYQARPTHRVPSRARPVPRYDERRYDPRERVVRPGEVRERATPQRRPRYDEPIDRERVRGRERPRTDRPPVDRRIDRSRDVRRVEPERRIDRRNDRSRPPARVDPRRERR